MKLLLLGLLLASFTVAADSPLQLYAEQWNTKSELTSVSSRLRGQPRIYETIKFTDERWHENIGLARVVATSPDTTAHGWIAVHVHPEYGWIDEIIFTERAPPAGFHINGVTGQTADVATTAAGLALGLTELNPIVASALPVTLPAKLALPYFSRKTGLGLCQSLDYGLARVGLGAAAWNVVAIAGGPVSLGAVALGSTVMLLPNNSFWDCVPKELWK